MNNFAGILKNLRVKRGLSQADLARLLGVGRSTIASYENGTRKPDHETLLQIAACFQVSTDFLLGNYKGNNNNEIPAYTEMISEINQLLRSTPLPADKKTEIINELLDYFRWKVEQAQQNLSEKEE